MLFTKIKLSKAIWFCLSLIIASIAAGLLISLIVAVRLISTDAMMLSEMPWRSLGVLSSLMIFLFRESERNRKSFLQVWDRIREDFRERRALRLVESIEDSSNRDTARLQLALRLVSPQALAQTRT